MRPIGCLDATITFTAPGNPGTYKFHCTIGVLDRIDEIVAPGTTVNPVDNSFNNPALAPSARRRSP